MLLWKYLPVKWVMMHCDDMQYDFGIYMYVAVDLFKRQLRQPDRVLIDLLNVHNVPEYNSI